MDPVALRSRAIGAIGAAQQMKNSFGRIRYQGHISLALALHLAIMSVLLGNE
ncbi:hypothetical protein [Methyloceanibacter sp.]|uniref:hypothetical protein n=1 Tax=Methyloceanibacter sp. TaxID=1965321 RepID=UPI002B620615|nr:hypothetical protein [Methyloceanibacter sp.]HML92417.1 hypothetical protein [Methyloceanibacter sp.]